MADFPEEGDDVWVEDFLGTVTYVSDPFKAGNIRNPDGEHPYGREITIFIEEGE